MAVQRNYSLPTLQWDRNVDSKGRSSIILTSDEQPILINAWTGDTMNTTRRDWRWAKLKTERLVSKLISKKISIFSYFWNQY